MNFNDIRQLWKEHGFRPDKRLGQNFLFDNNIRDNIIRALPLGPESAVVEIGAGFGVMTFAIAENCRKLVAVEKDGRICGMVRPIFAGKGNIELVHADFLEFDLGEACRKEGPLVVFGNIPYYISTPIIERIMNSKECVSSAHLVMQEELADRIVSPPGSKKYGSLSCYVQFYTRPRKLFKIKRNCFYPRPQVDSCMLRLEILGEPSVEVKDKELMFRIIRKAFSQRRKKVINPLSDKGFMPFDKRKWLEILNECGIDPSSRAEKLSLSDYARLADTTSQYL